MKQSIPALTLFALTLAACAGKPDTPPTPAGADPVACTEEAKECPDGSYVSREGPSCEFAECPASDAEPASCPEDALECPDGSVVTREGPDCEFPECPAS